MMTTFKYYFEIGNRRNFGPDSVDGKIQKI